MSSTFDQVKHWYW